MKITTLLLALLCVNLNASEVQWSVQHVKLKKQNLTGWQHDFYGKTEITPQLSAGLEGSYVERFSLYDTTYGGFLGYRFNEKFYGEAHYTQGIGNKILTQRQSSLVGYYSLMAGFSPYIILKDSRYSDTTVQDATLGMEIEKWPHIILIPQVMLGKSKFKSDKSDEAIYSYGLRAIYYTENKYSAFIYGFKGMEASQGITGAVTNNIRIASTTGGIGGSYHLMNNLKAELSVEHTDYRELKNQFITTIFSLNYKF